MRNTKAFSLIELLVVVAILGALMAVGVVSYNGYTASAKKSAAQNTMQQIGLMQTEYYSISGGYYTDASCPPTEESSQLINEDLFDADTNESVIGGEGYQFCTIAEGEGGYEIRACKWECEGTGDSKTCACADGTTLTLDAKGQDNF